MSNNSAITQVGVRRRDIRRQVSHGGTAKWRLVDAIEVAVDDAQIPLPLRPFVANYGQPRIVLAPSVRALRGDDYGDLADVAASLALLGDGALDPARLRRQYTVERGPWLRMVADLLGQVVADAGSVEHASAVLSVLLERLDGWVQRMVSRGCPHAAQSRWPVAPVADTPESVAYLDLVEAAERGAIPGDNAIEQPGVKDSYTVQFDSWDRMAADLLRQVLGDAGSKRKAAKLLSVPRSTLDEWTKRARPR